MKSLKLALISLALAIPAAACGGKHPLVGISEKYADDVCKCKDTDCLSKATDEYSKAAQEAAKSGAGSESDAKAIGEATKKATDCATKLATAPH